jgi:hypothetical protein
VDSYPYLLAGRHAQDSSPWKVNWHPKGLLLYFACQRNSCCISHVSLNEHYADGMILVSCVGKLSILCYTLTLNVTK